MESQRTKDLKKKRKLFGVLSYATWITTAVILLVFTFIAISQKEKGVTFIDLLSDSAKKAILSVGITTIIGIIGAIFIKDKIRTLIWMACLVMATVLFKDTGMFIVLGIWCVDEYVFTTLYKKYKNLVVINKEIDMR